MKIHILLIGFLLICLVSSCGTHNQSGELQADINDWTKPEYILFNTSNPAYCEMIAVEKLDEFLAENPGREEEIKDLIIPWKEFYDHQGKYLKDCQIRNDYPKYNLMNEVAKILVSNDGIMFSITWNGGIAVTYMDHEHARKIYDIYSQDPENYLKLEKDIRGDPIYPGHWLHPLLKNYKEGLQAQPIEQVENVKEIEKDQELFEFCLVKAKQGDAEFQTKLGILYQDGEEVERNYKEAIKWFKKAADQGSRLAADKLSIMYYEGKGVDKDYEIASMWLEKSFQDASANQQYHLAEMFRKGIRFPKDINEAYKWHKKAAERGNPAAQYRLEELCGEIPEACK
jgi:hypothetical protein